ncbi:MAG: FeoA family protein [Thermoguttaceae bacterium]|nr:FeoA family protein [Thermoguttaceae bacterium]
MMTSSVIPLDLLPRGHRAKVQSVAGPSAIRQRFEETGLRPGMELEMVEPGDPCLLRIEGTVFGFRSCGRFDVLVMPLS